MGKNMLIKCLYDQNDVPERTLSDTGYAFRMFTET